MCLLPDDSQIYISGLYNSGFSVHTCQETPVKLPTASIIFLLARFHDNGNIRTNHATKIRTRL